MATNKVIKVIRKVNKKIINDATSDYAEITVSKSGNNITITATYASAKTGKVAFYSIIPAVPDNNNAPASLTGWVLLGTSDITGTSTTFQHTLAEFSAISYCARMVLSDNVFDDNGTADFSS